VVAASSSAYSATAASFEIEDYYQNFKQSIKSKDNFLAYDHRLKTYMKYKQILPDSSDVYLDILEGHYKSRIYLCHRLFDNKRREPGKKRK
jgi:hypothetical protein